jgi:hypothetical protein
MKTPWRFGDKTRQMLEDAGWRQGSIRAYKDSIPAGFRLFASAQVVLQEFNGIEVGEMKGGKAHTACHIAINPALAEGCAEVFGKVATALGTELFPLGEIDFGHASLLINPAGWVYLWFGTTRLVAKSFDEALEKLLLGLEYDGDMERGQAT